MGVSSAKSLDAADLSRVAVAAEAVLVEQKISATVTSKPPRQLAVASAADPAVISAALTGAGKLSWLPMLSSVPATPAQSHVMSCRADRQLAVQRRRRHPIQARFGRGNDVRSDGDEPDRPNQGSVSVVTLTYDSATARAVGTYTAAHIGQTMALSDGREVITAPVIQQAITANGMQISAVGTNIQAPAISARITLTALRVEIRRG